MDRLDRQRRDVMTGVAAGLALGVVGCAGTGPTNSETGMATLVLHNGKISTLDARAPSASAIAIADGRVLAVGDAASVMRHANASTQVIDLGGRRVIPGLNDSHTHLIRGGLNYNLELRWENVPTLAEALRMLKVQAQRTPSPQWVRVVGGWSEFQFAERRMPTLDEINAAAPDTPVFVLHLYARALLNAAALRVLGIDRDTPNPPGGVIERDRAGNATGMLLAKPSALILYSTLARGPRLPLQDQLNSTRHFMRELNRLGITSVIDAGGGGQNYPEDYDVVQRLHRDDQLTVRIAYNLFAQKAGGEHDDYARWISMTQPGAGDARLRMNGAGENLTWSAADFENFLEPRPEPGAVMESELESIVELLAEHQWPFRIHATYDETIDRFLGVFERVNGRQPFATRFIIDHAETITPRNIERVARLGGGIAIQHRMAFQGEYFVDRYGAPAAGHTPPIKQMLAQGVPVGAGTDATRVASYDPWVCLHWLLSGRSLGGLMLSAEDALLDRDTALRLWTTGSAWFSGEAEQKGSLVVGRLADLAVLSDDYFAVETDAIRRIQSVLTVVGGRIVHASDAFAAFDPPLPPPSPEWSPQRVFESPGQRSGRHAAHVATSACALHGHDRRIAWTTPIPAEPTAFWGAFGCGCWAV
jgi:predicted amidohydrolase YtcJ